jgi:hypothetical protein
MDTRRTIRARGFAVFPELIDFAYSPFAAALRGRGNGNSLKDNGR